MEWKREYIPKRKKRGERDKKRIGERVNNKKRKQFTEKTNHTDMPHVGFNG